MSKNEPKVTTIAKYDVEAAIDEVENSEEESVFKYDFTILSDPKNVRLSIDGIVRIHGDQIERDEILTKDENEIPKILTVIYQELFPTFFLLSKTLNVSCPPHTIGKMGEAPTQESETVSDTESEVVETVAETVADTENETEETVADTENETEETVSDTETEKTTDEVELETPNAPQQ
jgi:gas vesicle protein